MATKPRSYKKDGYVYTESAPGSNRFQNFTAAKPTVKEARKDSAKKKSDAATKKYSATPTSDYRSPKTMPSATPTSDYRSPRSRPSATPTSDYRAPPVRGTPPAKAEETKPRTYRDKPRQKLFGGKAEGYWVPRGGLTMVGTDPDFRHPNTGKSRLFIGSKRTSPPVEVRLKDKASDKAPFQKGKGSPSNRKESFMSRTRRKGILGALFGN